MRQHARVVGEQTVVLSLNVTEGIGEQKGVRMLQRKSWQQARRSPGSSGGLIGLLVQTFAARRIAGSEQARIHVHR